MVLPASADRRIRRVLAPNPGPFTLEGTNTWIVGASPSIVIDPGPEDRRHLEAVHKEAGSVGAILLTHHHPDHAAGASSLSVMAGAPVMAAWPQDREIDLRDGEVVAAGSVRLVAVHTPGHAPDHVVFHDPGSRVVFTGDAVLGRGTSVIDPPEGDMDAYIRSLEAMAGLQARVIYPGHGPAVWDAGAKLQEYIEHRRLREQQVVRALKDGPRSPEELVPAIYPNYPTELHAPAARSVLAHLLKLESERLVVRSDSAGEVRFALAHPGAS